jgi:hypothetical protein
MHRLIGIIGCPGAGKDTCGDYLVKEAGYERTSFAKKVKDVAHVAFGWDRDMLEGITPESRAWRERVDDYWGISPRAALQKIGTEMFRTHIHPDFWVKTVVKEITDAPAEKRFVITDCRFENEVEAIKALGGRIIYIQRGDSPAWAALARAGAAYSEAAGVHITDWNPYALAKYADVEINNNSTLAELYAHLDAFVLTLA